MKIISHIKSAAVPGWLALLLAVVIGYNAHGAIRSAAKPAEASPADAQGKDPARQAGQAPWLGVTAEEASGALSAQLGLPEGEGLVLTEVAPDSPAARAGLQKNDVLVLWEDQRLVYPAQLRKLVQMRTPGDEIHLNFFHHGREQKATAILGKREVTGAESGALPPQWGDAFAQQMRERMNRLRESVGRGGFNGAEIQEQVRRSMEQARKAVEEALRRGTNYPHRFGPARNAWKDFSHSKVEINKDASITVRSHGIDVRTIVKSDDTGSYVIVANPRKWLTVHDKDGELVFDGEIETAAQQAKVPKETWEKVKPMLERIQ